MVVYTERYKKILKENAIKLARHHKKYCEGASCDISLILLRDLLHGCDIELTDEEIKEFV